MPVIAAELAMAAGALVIGAVSVLYAWGRSMAFDRKHPPASPAVGADRTAA